MRVFSSLLKGGGLKARFVRTSGLSSLNFGLAQLLRLISNLVLTRLLFPEAFGTMALVTVFLTGLQMFSDTGVRTSIQQNKRGDDQAFLDTAWTVQIIRGVILWAITLPLGIWAAGFYEAPLLAWLLPVGGVILFIEGVKPTWVYSAQRKLQIGRLTVLNLSSSVIGLIATTLLAWWLQSVWALVIGMVIARLAMLILLYVFRQGPANHLHFEAEAASELLRFGKWIFVSTICGFLNQQGDKLILGKYLALATLGLYQIAFFLASFPLLLGVALYGQVLIPYLREKPPAQSRTNFLAFRRIRLIVTGGLICLATSLALIGPFLVDVLYDDRYSRAGGIVVLMSMISIPSLLVEAYTKVSLSKGNSRNFAGFMITRTILNIGFLLVGVFYAGVLGALVGQGLARLIHYPIAARIAYHDGAWDPKLDLGLALLACCGCIAATFVHQTVLLELLEL